MAGHSKWANIKHRKGAQDAKRGKIFTKLIREIVTAAKLGGGDPSSNPRLRIGIDKALQANMTRDTINRAVERGTGGGEGTNMESITYEGYGPGGTAIMVSCLSDNRNRTVSEVRHAFNKSGGNLGTDGSVSYLFTKRGIFTFSTVSEEEIMDVALEAGCEDIITNDDGSLEVYGPWEDFSEIKDALIAGGFTPDNAEITQVPSTSVELTLETAPQLLKLIDLLEDCDDVQEVYHNGDISDEVASQL